MRAINKALNETIREGRGGYYAITPKITVGPFKTKRKAYEVAIALRIKQEN